MKTQSVQILRGNLARAVVVTAVLAVTTSSLLALALWLFSIDTTATKVAVEIKFLIWSVVLVIGVAIAAAGSVAKVHNNQLDFHFCGIRTRSFPLDSDTTFELRKIGKLEVLQIRRGRSYYIPNGSFDKKALVSLLRTSGVAELQTKRP